MNMMPTELRTARLWLRQWCAADASELLTILERNLAHLQPWIPEHVYSPVPVAELHDRLAGYSADFVAARSWRYATFAADSGELLGEVSVFPRSSEGRVSLESADRVEIGYWLRSDATGRGYVTEAVRALLDVVARLLGVATAEIHCDARNERSASVPRRLGFVLVNPASVGTKMVWSHTLGDRPLTPRS